jgi:RNA polymerase sigma-70 factor (ECF subfamily)
MERPSIIPSRERERDLVLAFQSGNAAAYDSIDHSCRPAAERICRRLLINPADVEEAVQETMVRAYQGLPRFNGSYALTAWIARIATNVCLDTLRARSRRPQTAGPIEPGMETPNGHEVNGHHQDPEDLVVKVFEAQEVRHVLAELPERHRTALVLREFEGYSHRRIAEMLDTSPQRVKALIHRAKAGFRRAWKDEGPGRLAAFAPLLTPINWVRRMLGKAPEFDYSVTTSVATTASSPVAQSVMGVATERISTAVAAVMLAGTVGFAVQHGPKPSRAEEQAAVPIEIVSDPVEKLEQAQVKEEKEKAPKPKPEASPAPAVVPSPEATVEEEVLEEPKDPEVPAGDLPPSDVPPPHPSGFSYTFSSDRTAEHPCGCGGSSSLSPEGVSISDTSFDSYQGTLSGAITDANGQAAWAFDGRLDARSDAVAFPFSVRTQFGTSPYDAHATLTDRVREGWGGWTYRYSGTYQWHGGPSEHSELPHNGSFSVSLTVSWVEQRLVSAVISLNEG